MRISSQKGIIVCSRMLLAIGSVFVAAEGALGQADRKTQDAVKPTAEPQAVEARFGDGSTMKLIVLQDAVHVATRYGKLTVPTREISRIDVGVRITADTARRIERAIADLESPEYRRREQAGKDLLELRELALPALMKSSKSSSAEVADHATKLLKTLRETTPGEILARSQDDLIVTPGFTISGRIESDTIKVRTTYFGDRDVPLCDVRVLRWLGSLRDAKLKVDAERYGGQQEAWLDTKYMVNAGAKLRITASGAVDLWPVAPEVGVYMAGPEGMTGGGGAVIVQGRGVARVAQQFAPGALVGRIGENGKAFLVWAQMRGYAYGGWNALASSYREPVGQRVHRSLRGARRKRRELRLPETKRTGEC